MKKVRFTEEQMVTILREADKSTVAEVARKHKISEQTIYVWKRRFGTLQSADVKRLRELETENAKLKRQVETLRTVLVECLKVLSARNKKKLPAKIREILEKRELRTIRAKAAAQR